MMIRDEYERLENLKYLNELEAGPEDVPSRAFHRENYKSQLFERMDRSKDPLGLYPDISPPRYERGQESWDSEQEKVMARKRAANRAKNPRFMNVRNFDKANLRHVSPMKRFASNGGKAFSNGGRASPRVSPRVSPRSPRDSPNRSRPSPRESQRSPRVSPRSQGGLPGPLVIPGLPGSKGGRPNRKNSPLTFYRQNVP